MIDPTSVPVPSDAWVAARRDHLLAELRRTPERRAHRRLVGGMAALAVAGAATAAVLLIAGGPAASTAFAGWRAAPTAAGTRPTAGRRGELPGRWVEPGRQSRASGGGAVGPAGALGRARPLLDAALPRRRRGQHAVHERRLVRARAADAGADRALADRRRPRD